MISRDELMTPCLLKVANVDRSADDDSESSDDDLQSTIQKGYNQCRGAWKLLLDKRHDDLKLHSGLTSSSKSKFQELEKGLWDQIQATVAHERVMGQDSAADTNHSSVRTFDDGKVYQNMLRDFISSGVSNQGNSSNDAASERLKAFQAKLLKKKSNGSNRPNKPDVDRKASKGRKLRYVVHPKLTNFTFPIMRVEPAIHENDWFKSIFGGMSSRK
uniref:Apoptosis-antagonizing transcription factor C-terminal domain-containing protein n=1 Tax=Proboscia inermis TaxID=420281 RepID=A0A6T8LZD7_9STRA|mmetsp:Transcript_40551/g.41227  ORF Transcript_40551/g.41227 Transcript_40551/m.41227 type:complete len:216 (+) Transcript_40551:3-650(+)